MSAEEKISSEQSQPVHTSENASADKNLESRLNKYVQNAMNQTVEKYLSYIKFRSFKETFPEIYQENRTHLKEIHTQFLIQLKDFFKAEAKEICDTSDLHSSLYLLDNLIKKYEDRTEMESWRPSGVPSKDLRDHLHQVKLKQKKCLEFQLQTLITENESIEKIVKEKHREIMNSKSSIDHLNQDLKSYFHVIHDGSIAHLEKEILSNLEDT